MRPSGFAPPSRPRNQCATDRPGRTTVGATAQSRLARSPRRPSASPEPAVARVDHAHPPGLRAQVPPALSHPHHHDAERPLFPIRGSGAAGPHHHSSGRADGGLSRRLRQLVHPRAGARRHLRGQGRQRHPRRGRVGPDRRGRRAAPGRAPAHRHARLPPGEPLLRERCPVGRGVAPVRPHAARMGAGEGHRGFRPRPHRLRLSGRELDPHRGPGLCRGQGRVPRLRPPRGRLLPGHEHPDPLLHGIYQRHRPGAALRPRRFRGLDRGLPRRALAHVRPPQQRAPQGPSADGLRPRRRGRVADPHLRASYLDEFRVWTDEVPDA